MQVKIDRETLLKGVGRTLGVVDRRGTMPILGNFLLQTDENRVLISATDLEVSFRGFYPAEVLEHGAVTVQAHYFFNLIKELPADSVDLTGTDKAGLKILAGESRYQLNGLPADQFPPVPEITDQNLVEVESRMVKEMIEKTIFSVSVDDLQYHLSSIFWERVETEPGLLLRLISTDGHRLTLIERPLPGSEQVPIEKGILIPRKGMAEVIRFLAEEEKVSLGLGTQSLALGPTTATSSSGCSWTRNSRNTAASSRRPSATASPSTAGNSSRPSSASRCSPASASKAWS